MNMNERYIPPTKPRRGDIHLVDGLEQPDQGMFIEKHIERFLDLEGHKVKGEV